MRKGAVVGVITELDLLKAVADGRDLIKRRPKRS